jgi:acetyl-CoA carboxylase biotin carboxyl carrier protein
MSNAQKKEDTMNDNFIITLLEKFDASSIKELSIEKEGVKISFNKNCSTPSAVSAPYTASAERPSVHTAAPVSSSVSAPSSSQAPEVHAAAPASEGLFIKSPIVGTFYRSPSPDSPAYAEKGKTVKKGQPLCILEAMKMMNTLEAEYDCVIEDILASNGDLVEFDQNLFKVKKL